MRTKMVHVWLMMKPDLHQVFDSLSTAVLLLGPDNTCLYVNEACEAILLKSRGVLTGSSISHILGNEPDIVRVCDQVRGYAESIVLREIEIYLPEWQRHLLVDLIISPCPVKGLDETVLLELIDRKEVQKLSHDTDMLARFKVATQIVRGLAHEIKNPLGGIRGAAQLLALEMDTPEAEEYTSVIIQEVDRLSALLNRMSSGNQCFESTQLDIHESLTDIAELLKVEYGEILAIEYNFDTSLPRIEMNLDQIKQALLNLMQNAAQWALVAYEAGEKDALVMVKTRAVHPNPMRSLMPQRGVRIQITDNGPGVDSSIIEQLFLPMVTRREGGTGLGLSISQEIAQNHGGFIELDHFTKPGETSFSLYLPYVSNLHSVSDQGQ